MPDEGSKLTTHYDYTLIQIVGKSNMPAEVFSRLDHITTEMPDISSHVPVRSIRAVQTRQSSMKVTKDLEEMAIRGHNNKHYQQLMDLIKHGTNFQEQEEESKVKDLQQSGRTSRSSTAGEGTSHTMTTCWCHWMGR